MRRALWLAALVLSPFVATAETVRVQTGEHADFTRVVLTLPAGPNWEVRRGESGYDIRLPGASAFELARFYDLVPRTRIAEVAQSADGETLSLDVDCLCNIDAFIYLDRFLVVDVRDGAPDPLSPFEIETPADEVATNAPSAGRQFQIVPNPLIPLFVPAPAMGASQPETASVEESISTDLIASEEEVALPEESSGFDINQLSADIAQSVARALSEGLIGPPRAVERDEGLQDIAITAATLPGITMRTSREQASGTGAVMQDQQQLACVPDDQLAIEDWADERSFSVQLRALADGLFAEDAPTDEAALIAFARFYLYFGFAEEAAQLLQADGRNSVATQLLATLAQVMMGGEVADPRFRQQVACDGRVALWALLTSGELDAESRSQTAMIVSDFRRLPPEVKALVGPRLAEVFLEAGDVDAAMQILGRVPEEGAIPSELTTATSDLEAAQDRPEEAAAILDAAITQHGVIDAPVLTRLLTLGAEGVVQPAAETVALADAVLFEARGSAAAGELALAQYRYHLAAGDFAAATGLLDDPAAFAGMASSADLKAEFAQAAVDRMNDMAFGRYAWKADLLPEDPTARALVAARLDGMGFPERAAALRLGVNDVSAGPGINSETYGQRGETPVSPSPSGNASASDLEANVQLEPALASLRALVSTSQKARAQTTETLAQTVIPLGQ